ncbi:bifunctional oligoribonuclease/PAP phosphatase NrnA [Flavobacterium jejuense]|uniref:Bifunctional oligoribonuclease/PAP phosphatase NrnA n=1 Tax=Flavobacterium jejuense TaxID=1544455 RepID=A0ABX0INK2_9FLAO|nr:bifunctional oligoribonuclease/PAP phosphatase NrnA [Flavobacterium jejuense]NHN24625.1 bifunctional oligoribonuclease/PAP phosphatase NrnA [Flavobacterium jejuense]
MLSEKEITEIKSLLNTPKKITIISHRNPDGDAMGSSLGLLHFLKQLNHEVIFISPNEFPDFLAWLPETNKVVIFEREYDKALPILQKSDLIFTLDFNAIHRTGDAMQKILETLSNPMIMIDHHQFPDDYAKYTFSDVSYGSTCQMIYDFINALGYNNLINKEIATCLYTGIVTDSGSFRFPKTTSETHKCVANLIEKGINNSEIHNLLFDNSSYERLQLLGKALQNLRVLPEYKASYISLSQEELNAFDYKKGDTEGIVNYGLSIQGIIVTAIFIENKEEGIIKISFRSQGDFDVNEFARKHFNGGGHINAAGGKSFSSLEETVNQFIAILAEEKK